jgi:hypothetical protein
VRIRTSVHFPHWASPVKTTLSTPSIYLPATAAWYAYGVAISIPVAYGFHAYAPPIAVHRIRCGWHGDQRYNGEYESHQSFTSHGSGESSLCPQSSNPCPLSSVLGMSIYSQPPSPGSSGISSPCICFSIADWLPLQDSNLDSPVNSRMSYHWTKRKYCGFPQTGEGGIHDAL